MFGSGCLHGWVAARVGFRADIVPRLSYASVEGTFLELKDASPVRRCEAGRRTDTHTGRAPGGALPGRQGWMMFVRALFVAVDLDRSVL
jgi:hypothetical protein